MRAFIGRLVVGLLAIATTTGCQAVAPRTANAAGDSQPAPLLRTVTVAGIDCSRSYNMAQASMAILIDTVQRELRADDVMYVRLIVARSYDEGAAYYTVTLPTLPPAPDNPYDRKGRARLRLAQQQVELVRAAGIRRLTDFRVSDVPLASRAQTDIYGFLAKAGELLGKVPDGVEKAVIIGTDLEDNAHQGLATINLKNARVVVFYFQGGADVRRAQRRRERWTDELTGFGAREVVFMDPSEGSGNGLIRPRTRSSE